MNSILNPSLFYYHKTIGTGSYALIPYMTSYTAPSGSVAASSYNILQPYLAFQSGSNPWLSDTSGYPQWIYYQFYPQYSRNPTVVSYQIANNNYSFNPITYQLQGTTDIVIGGGTVWTTLDTRYGPSYDTDVIPLLGGPVNTYATYRIYITSGVGTAVQLTEFQLFGYY